MKSIVEEFVYNLLLVHLNYVTFVVEGRKKVATTMEEINAAKIFQAYDDAKTA